MLDRSIAFARRMTEFTRFGGGPISAVKLLVAMKRDPYALQRIALGRHEVFFRKVDESAIREVLFLEQYGFLKPLLRSLPAPKVLDVGANIGCFSSWLSTINANAKVLAIEPSPALCRLAETNLSHSPLENWKLLQKAASASDNDRLHLNEVGQSVSHRVSKEGRVGEQVAGVSLKSAIDALAGPSGRVDLAKIDIEGSEEAFLSGKSTELSRIDALVLELHPNICGVASVLEVLHQTYPYVEEVSDRDSAKPLILCRFKRT